MKQWKWTHNGFHGFATIRLMVPDDAKAGDEVEVSERVARRLNRIACMPHDCMCGEDIATRLPVKPCAAGRSMDPFDGTYYVWLPEYGAVVSGNYPQI